ncbi:MAG TPA: hypothetical protein DFI01_04155 [Bacteroidales bacterium]|nr:hypothetical protein [Bacteroidales bacterium]
MKRLIPVILIVVFVTSGCGSSKKQMQKGNYGNAVELAVRQLRKNPDDAKQRTILENSYKIANEQDIERIRFLKTEGKPDNWDEIYIIYKRLYDRQALVRTVPDLNVPYVDYMQEMIEAKRKAADYYYAHGIELMKHQMKESYRQAYGEFIRAKEYVGDYENIDNKIAEAKYMGMSRVLVSVQNKSVIRFPKEFEEDLLELNLPALNSEWVEYYTEVLNPDIQFDYFINVNILSVIVGPDQTVQRDSVIKKEIEDGFTYVLDKKGNVMKDSLGNDIKMPKYKTVQCALIETVQQKICRIEGDVELIQANPGKVLKKDPIGAQSTFEHVSARALGDINALSSEQVERTKSQPLPFPGDVEMVMRCSKSLKMAIRGAITNSRRLII